jgi:hypothetical protein
MFVTAASGTSLGLLISSLVADAKTAANFVPLVLIPQLIFGGALIKYEEMNRDLEMVYTFKRWLTRHPGLNVRARDDSSLRVPLISRFVATHYSYEALIVAQAKRNPLALRQEQLQMQMDTLVSKRQRTEVEAARLEELKDTLALLSGMEASNYREIEKKLDRVDAVINGQPLDTGGLKSRPNGVVSAERLFTNQKVSDLVAKAETEQNDYRLQHSVNPFFSPEKHYDLDLFGHHRTFKISVYAYSASILIGSSMVLLGLLHFVLRRQLRTKGT